MTNHLLHCRQDIFDEKLQTLLDVDAVAGGDGCGDGLFFPQQGNVFLSEDGRPNIVLAKGEKASVLGEMRDLLEGVQTITVAIAMNDMETVAMARVSNDANEILGRIE